MEKRPDRSSDVNIHGAGRELRPVRESGSSPRDEAFRTIADAISAAVGDAFFLSLVEYFAKALHADYAFIGETSPGADSVRTIAVYAKGKIDQNFEYGLKGTPCENIIGQTLRWYPAEVQRKFPDDRLLVTLGVESYIGTPLFDSARQAIGLMAVMHGGPLMRPDVAEAVFRVFAPRVAAELERKRTETTLRESEARYRDLFENAMDAIFVVDENLRYVDVNRRATEIMGFSRDEFLRMSILDVIPQEQTPRSEEEFRKLRERGQYENFTGKMRTKDGRWLDIEVNSSAIIRDGRVVGSRDIVRDITERRRMEAEVVKAQRLESIGILAGGIAHDFNNLLVGILGNLELARMGGQPAEAVLARLDEAEKACLRAQDLTRQLLTFSRGGAPVKKTVFIDGIVRESAQFALRGSNVSFDFRAARDLRPADIDEGQISQVLHNLIINAQQAMKEGGTIDIDCSNVSLRNRDVPPLPAGPYVRIEIRDRGVGIPAEHLPRIFDPYFTTKQKGSGLGLATSYSIIKQHGGSITVESTPGEGTRFSVYLPASSGTPEARTERVEVPLRGRGRVLVMDDEDTVRDVASEILRRLGYDVVSVGDGAEAVERYAQAMGDGSRFDLVIMDLTVPGGMGGLEALRRIRDIDPAVKAIVSSGYSNDPVMAEYRRHGFSGVVSKPYRIGDMGEVVARLIAGAM